MNSKRSAIFLSLAALLLAVLLLLAYFAGRERYGNLLLVKPLSTGAPGLSPKRLDELLEDEFLLTYELRRPATAQAVNEAHSVTTVGTNPSYARLLGYPILDGGFFTPAAMDAKSRQTVLNETAAHQIFGSVRIAGQSLKLEGETWIVTGVIRDGDEEAANLYLPAGTEDGQVDSLLLLMDGRVTEAYARNALKGIGIHETGYEFLNLSRSAAAFAERFAVAGKAASFALLFRLVLHIGALLSRELQSYRMRLRSLYFREILAHCRVDFLKTTGGVLLLFAGIAAMLLLSLQILGTCLAWQELVPITGELCAGSFGHKLIWLREHELIGVLIFWVCAGTTALWLILSLPRPSRKERGIYGESESA